MRRFIIPFFIILWFKTLKAYCGCPQKEYALHSIGIRGMVYVQHLASGHWFVSKAESLYCDYDLLMRFSREDLKIIYRLAKQEKRPTRH
jgi:hypothetical protein